MSTCPVPAARFPVARRVDLHATSRVYVLDTGYTRRLADVTPQQLADLRDDDEVVLMASRDDDPAALVRVFSCGQDSASDPGALLHGWTQAFDALAASVAHARVQDGVAPAAVAGPGVDGGLVAVRAPSLSEAINALAKLEYCAFLGMDSVHEVVALQGWRVPRLPPLPYDAADQIVDPFSGRGVAATASAVTIDAVFVVVDTESG